MDGEPASDASAGDDIYLLCLCSTGKNVSDVTINQNSAVPTGTVSVTLKDDGNTRKVNVSDVEQVEKLLTENQVEYRLSDVPKDSMLTTVVVPMLITLGGVFLIFFLMSRQNGGGIQRR